MLEQELHRQLSRLRPQRVLMVSAAGAELPALPEARDMHLVILRGDRMRADSALVCSLDALPFETGAFDVVIYCHSISDGHEAELEEGCRVLRPGGQLLVTGCGGLGGARSVRWRSPALRAGRLCRALNRREFRIEQCMGLGLRGRPLTLQAGWQRPLLVFCERVLIRARRRDRETIVRPLRFSRTGPVSARGAALDGLSRQAIQ
jgi:SAM-dependent methyltransferase